MHEKAKFACFNYMQPQKVKFKSVQINMKHVSYVMYCCVTRLLQSGTENVLKKIGHEQSGGQIVKSQEISLS